MGLETREAKVRQETREAMTDPGTQGAMAIYLFGKFLIEEP